MKKSNFLGAVFLQFMGAVGSGIFVLPYLFAHSNFIFASVFLIFLTLVTAALNHLYVEVVTSTPGDHQLTGYAQIYLGKKFKLVTTLNIILLAFGAITAYSKLFQSFFALLFPQLINISPFLYIIVIFVLFSLALSRERVGLGFKILIPLFMLLVPLFLFLFSFTSLKFEVWSFPNFSFYGATLFALSSFTIIPEVQEKLGTNKKLPLAVFLGLTIAAICYFFYTFAIVRLSGPTLSIDSISGLVASYPLIAKLLAVFGVVVTTRASLNFLIILRELFYRDLKIAQSISNVLSFLFIPVALLLKTISLITVISLTGHFTIFISALIICLVRLRLPHTFWTQFWIILVMISLSLGLIINTIF